MELFIAYFIRASIYLFVFGLGYALLLRRNIFPSFNRFYILGSGIASLVLPLISGVSFTFVHSISKPGAVTLPEIIVTASEGYNQTTGKLSHILIEIDFLNIALLLINISFLLVLSVQLIQIFLIIMGNQRCEIEGMTLVKLKKEIAPFSFFRWLFITDKVEKTVGFEKVLKHEKAHCTRLHSLDVIVFEILRIVFWFHPVFYYLRSELKTMHEFEADALALKHFNKSDYQKTLLEMTFSGGLIPITNPFNVSLIKKRMLMMNHQKRQKPARNWFKLLILLPFVWVAILVQSCNFDKKETQTEPRPEDIMSTKVDSTGKIKSEMVNPEKEFADAEPIEGDIFTVVQDMPEYPGGPGKMMEFIAKNIIYPPAAREKGIQGRVFINFIVETDGSVSNVKVLRGIGGGCDEEAVRVVSMMSNWKPGQQRGQNVRVSFNIPIKFLLN
ncbi:MAG: hypothetical protein CVT92_02005 [Bacteroidetes bacterium HGW-Bacteroidetes-1]|jgi:TonB family protein|nr:MAG: hypothetical protein CVT92_02005 [Bacteroidetes bacterium HGW-Bacteroidetes-1]